jgi:hypothetical protein
MIAKESASNTARMRDLPQAYLLCKDKDCAFNTRPILLPALSQLTGIPDRQQLPKVEWQAVVACPIAGHVFAYKQSDVHWLGQQDQAPQSDLSLLRVDWFSVPIECAIKGCAAKVVLHISSPAGTTGILDLSALLETKVAFSGKLPCGHHFVPRRKEDYHPQNGWVG